MHRLRSRTCERMTTAAAAVSFPVRTISARDPFDRHRRILSVGCTSPRGGRVLRRCRGVASRTAGRLAAGGGPARTGPSCPAVHRRLRSTKRACRHRCGLRSSGPVPRRNVGNDVRTPGVSAQPGASHARRSGRAAAARPTSGRGLPAAFGPRVHDGAATTVGSAIEGGDRERLGVHASGGHPEHAPSPAWHPAAAATDRSSGTARPHGWPRPRAHGGRPPGLPPPLDCQAPWRLRAQGRPQAVAQRSSRPEEGAPRYLRGASPAAV